MTDTPTPIPNPPEVNIGHWDHDVLELDCGSSAILDLGAPTWIGTLIFYEAMDAPECGGGICLNWITIDLSSSAEGPWSQIFYWGDADSGNNGAILDYHFPPELDSEIIPYNELHHVIGVMIGVGDTHRYVRFSAPNPCSNPAQVDAVEILP